MIKRTKNLYLRIYCAQLLKMLSTFGLKVTPKVFNKFLKALFGKKQTLGVKFL